MLVEVVTNPSSNDTVLSHPCLSYIDGVASARTSEIKVMRRFCMNEV